MLRIRTIVIVLFFATLFLLSHQLLFAQTASNPLNVTISPSYFDLTAKPGDTVENKMRVYNNSTTPIDLTVTVKKLTSDPQTGQPVPADPTAKDEYISWLQITPNAFKAQPQEWTTIDFKLSVPKDAAFGYYYVIQIAPKDKSVTKGNGPQVQGQILAALLLNVPRPGSKASLQLVDFKPTHFVNEYMPIDFTTTILNNGNIHVRPQGNIFIRNDLQKDLGVLELNPALGAILPEGKRGFTSSWNEGFIVREPVMENNQVKLDAKGEPVTNLKFNWNKLTDFRIGKYTASLLVVYDTGKRDQTMEATTDFWVVPYTAIGVFVVSLFLIILIVRFLIKSYVQTQIRKHNHGK